MRACMPHSQERFSRRFACENVDGRDPPRGKVRELKSGSSGFRVRGVRLVLLRVSLRMRRRCRGFLAVRYGAVG